MNEKGSNGPDRQPRPQRDEALYQDLKRVLTMSEEELAEFRKDPEWQRRRKAIEERSKERQGESLFLPIRRKPR